MGRPRDESIDGLVVDACAQLLGEIGRAQLTRQRVARRAGVSLPAVSRRFLSVDDLLLAVASRPRRQRPLPETPGDFEPYLVAVVGDLAGDGWGLGRRGAAELVAAAAGDVRIARALSAAEQAARREPLQVLQTAQDKGHLAAGLDVGLLLDQLIGVVCYRLLWLGEEMTGADLTQLVKHAVSQ